MTITSQYFDKKLVLVTGGSSGIGKAIATECVSYGANVFILARRLEQLTSTILCLKDRKIHNDQRIGLISTDVSDNHQIHSILTKFIEKVGVPDIVINSAGIVKPGTVTELEIKSFQSIMDVNFFGTVNVTKELLPAMMQRHSGHIINISSFVGFYASYGYSAYAASKFAVRGFSDVIRAELKPLGIRVSVVFPADTDTPQLAQERKEQSAVMRDVNSTGGLMPAEKVAHIILTKAAKNRYVITPGFESSFAYLITTMAGYLQYPLMDSIIAKP